MPKQAQIELFGRAAVQFTRPSAPCNPVDNVPLLLNIEALANGPVQLKGELSPEELGMETLDELVEADEPLDYDLTAERAGDNILLQGQITMRLQCECARCLRAFEHRVELQGWSCLLPLNGDEKIELINNSGDYALPAGRYFSRFSATSVVRTRVRRIPQMDLGGRQTTQNHGGFRQNE